AAPSRCEVPSFPNSRLGTRQGVLPMPKTAPIKPTHKAVKQYYAALQSYRNHQVTHEGALETAFGRLLEETAKSHGWKLIPKQRLKVGKSSIAPDGTLRDLFNMRCGFWEAKDTDDDLRLECCSTTPTNQSRVCRDW